MCQPRKTLGSSDGGRPHVPFPMNLAAEKFPRPAFHRGKSRSHRLQTRPRRPLLLERLEDRTLPTQLLGSLALGNQPLGEIAVNPNTDQVYVAGGFGPSPMLVVNALVPANPMLVTSI